MREGSENVFGIRRNPLTTICPIKGMRDKSELTLRVATCFARQHLMEVFKIRLSLQLLTEARLKVYLKKMGADNGETLHGFRSGCAITLALTGAELSEIMDHVDWSNRHTALYYMQLAKVLNPCGASAKLASSEVFKGPLKYLLMPLLGKNQLAITLHMYALIGPNLDNSHRGQI